MNSFIVLLAIAMAALARTNRDQARKLKKISFENSDYNKIYEENIELHTAVIQLEIKNSIIIKKKNELLVSIVKLQVANQEKLPITYSVN